MTRNKDLLLILERREDDDYCIQDILELEIDSHFPSLTRESVIVWLEDHGVVFEDD
jgi:hypothetical protein